VGFDLERMKQFFVTRSLSQNELDFDIPVRVGVSEFYFITVDSRDVFDAFMAVKSDASGLDGIPFHGILLPVVLPALTHLFNFIFTC
jgi:hypothetical protein